ncbi:hypothetical protein IMSHALPRED_010152 [Imshaugia aleurites]|uniref:Uncharacterized protein n=1 Tax=Imshaugia aleurites TaxID=172621 RepID=A0A8H3G5N1_9LECA|nr:hypothetical protein IMSHALPRED_010152 [Imshaugia aleurites]
MNSTTTCNPTTPTAETDEGCEHEQMSGALLAEEKDILPSETSSAVIEDPTTPRTWYQKSLRKSGDLSETSLEVLERTHPIDTTKPNTSLEALENAHHESQIGVEPKVLTRNNDTSLGQRPSNTSTETPSKIPLPFTSSNGISSTHPSLILLPPSLFEADGSDESNPPTSVFSESCHLYWENNSHLSRQFPHLKCVRSSSRYDKANITIFDYVGSALKDTEHLSTDFKLDNSSESENILGSKFDECRQFICSNNSLSQVDRRLVVVEDLGPSLINVLGATFDLSPEIFEEHLHRSRYGGSKAPGMPPSNWRTSNLQKDYVSFAWYRPGESWTLGMDQEERKDLLDQNRVLKRTQCLDKSGQSKSVTHKYWLKTNIFRWSSEMSTNPAGQLPDRVPCGWEERATMCSVEVEGLQYGKC